MISRRHCYGILWFMVLAMASSASIVVLLTRRHQHSYSTAAVSSWQPQGANLAATHSSSSSVSRGLQGLAALQALQAMPHETTARHAARMEILLGELAGNQHEVLDKLQGFVQLDEMDENQLALHIDMLEDMVSARLQQAPAGAPAAKGHGTAQQSSGPRAAAHDPSCERVDLPEWCYAFEGCNVTRIAVVGNGPLSMEQREDLRSGAYQVVVRFNFMNNRAPGEQLDVWVMRRADPARLHFWGISQMESKAALEALSAVKSIWFLGKIPNDWDSRWALMQPIYRHYPEVKARHHMVVDRQVISVNETDVGSAGMTPSSGWLGASFAAECSRRIGAELHIFGYNWNAAHADTHSIGTEEALFRLAEQNGELVIHPTACDGLRSCAANATHKDCHLLTADVATAEELYNCTNTNLGVSSK